MIVKNEAENLPRLFASIEGCFDEIHITDTGSTDNTVELAQSLGAIVHPFEWCDDFSAARNASFAPIKTDYVAWLDGDDVLENREAFISFRDHVMGLADYWLAAYHYSSDATGKPICTFARERVFRVDKGMHWKYFVHEGVIPSPGARAQFTPAWAVRHKRTDQDLQKDRSRNLKLFENRVEQLDARMRYYYGKELFEASRPVDAIPVLLKAASLPELELHDRILAIQFCCYAYLQCNQFEAAIQLAYQGLQLSPHRAELWVIIGDAYLKMNRFADAIPAFSAAKSCKQIPSGVPTPIFHTEETYTTYPRLQLAKIHANLGDFDQGEKESESVGEHPEAKAITAEIRRIRGATTSYKNARPCEDIVITCPPQAPYLWDADIAKEKAMGGSETAAIEMAHWLHKLSGRKVLVFNARESSKTCDGVEYHPTPKVVDYMAVHKPFLNINWRHNYKITDAPTFLWCHDLQTPGAENIENYEKLLCLTPFHKRYAMATQGIPEDKIWVTRNGVRPDRFTDGPWEKDPWKFVFSSSPDRGLDRAMLVLDQVREKYPLIKLHIYYGIEHLPQYGHQALHDTLKAMMEERKDWVVYHGATQQEELMREFKSAAYCVQPSDWIETSMISARERLYCGVYQIIRAVGGAVDTLAEANTAGMAKLVDSECITPEEYQTYVDATIEAIEQEAYKRIHCDPKEWSWEGVARAWLRDLPNLAGYMEAAVEAPGGAA